MPSPDRHRSSPNTAAATPAASLRKRGPAVAAPRTRPAVLDIEASGLTSRSYPIEVGVVRADGARYCRLIRPQPDWTHWDPAAERIHGIRRETLLERGVAADLIALELNRFLHGTTVYSDCWVLDKPWLTRLFEAAGTSPGFWLSPIELIITEPQLLGWASIRDQVVLDLGLTRHRASADALIVQETWVRSQAA